MRADLRAFFKHDHGKFAIGRGRELLEPDCGGQTSRASPDDHDIEFHDLALGQGLE